MDNPPDFMALWDYQDPAASALRFHTLLPEARAAADLQLELELLTQIARTHSLQRQFCRSPSAARRDSASPHRHNPQSADPGPAGTRPHL